MQYAMQHYRVKNMSCECLHRRRTLFSPTSVYPLSGRPITNDSFLWMILAQVRSPQDGPPNHPLGKHLMLPALERH